MFQKAEEFKLPRLKRDFGKSLPPGQLSNSEASFNEIKKKLPRTSLGILNDKESEEVPGKPTAARMVEPCSSSIGAVLMYREGRLHSAHARLHQK